jgi:hypothetical protein
MYRGVGSAADVAALAAAVVVVVVAVVRKIMAVIK